MRKIKKVKIIGFWGDKTVDINLNKDINFLIGLNGSGKTTIINLIAASLKADFQTLDKFQFSRIRIDFFELKPKEKTFIEVEKIEKEDSPYPNIVFKIKIPSDEKVKHYNLDELEEEGLYRNNLREYMHRKHRIRSGQAIRDIHEALFKIVNVSWLSVHRTSTYNKNHEESFVSTIDHKIKEIQSDLEKYFGILEKRYSTETERFQKNIFLSLIKDDSNENLLETSDLNSEKEKEALKQIFELFGLRPSEFHEGLEKHFQSFDKAKHKLEKKAGQGVELNDFAAVIGTRRIHTIVQEWNLLNQKKSSINKPKFTFIDIINNLFQKKQIFINERNELWVRTEGSKEFTLTKLSSGEKQLLIILGQSLLQESKNHIYIADEPELSLHVEWQEKLVNSVKDINPNSQVIFATHSPDIVGKYSDYIIQIEKVVR